MGGMVTGRWVLFLVGGLVCSLRHQVVVLLLRIFGVFGRQVSLRGLVVGRRQAQLVKLGTWW